MWKKLETRIFDWTDLHLLAVLQGVCVHLVAILLVTVLFLGIGLLMPEVATSLDDMPEGWVATALGATGVVGVLLVYGLVGFVAARSAGEQELFHAVVAALLAPYFTWAALGLWSGTPPLGSNDTGLLPILAAMIGGMVTRRR